MFKENDKVKFKYPEKGEEHLVFTVLDDTDQTALLIHATNSTLMIPPVEEVGRQYLTLVK